MDDELLYSDESHPTASAILESGALSIRRTKQTIFRTHVDFEFRADNVNADVQSRLKGMASFSKSVSARRKWIVTRIVPSELVSHLIESQDWKRMQMTSSHIRRDNADLNKLITGSGTTMNSFLTDFRDEKLYCISQVRWYLKILQGAF